MTLLLACALVLASLIAAPPADAATTPTAAKPATSATLSGKGYSQTDPISMEPGYYEVIFTYKNNVDPAHESYISAHFHDQGLADEIVHEFAEANTIRRIVLLPKSETRLDVTGSDNVEWTASLKKLAPPTKPKSALAVEGTGTGSGTLFLLKEGTYELTAAWSNNNGPRGDERAEINVRRPDGLAHNLAYEQTTSGKKNYHLNVWEDGIYWIDVDAHSTTDWAVVMEPTPDNFWVQVRPSISGTAKLGSTLTARTGTWSPKPTKSTYQWLRSGTTIKGATSSTYKPTSADCGKALSVKVTGTRTGRVTESVTSKATAKVACSRFSTTPTPKISGTTKVGSTLTAKAGTWRPTPTLTYQWYRGSSKISGATASKYTLNTFDCGRSITVKVTAKKTNYTPASATSRPVTPTAKGSGKVTCSTFTTKPTPTISGTAKVGNTLTAKAGTWKPKPTTQTYQWLRNGAKISGATKSTYTLTGTDRGKKITVKVTGKRTNYRSTSSTSAATKKVAAGTLTTSKPPTISGTAEHGHTLTATPGTWKQSPTKFAYRWHRDGEPIAFATKTTYALTQADIGFPITVVVTATKDGYATARASSAATKPVIPPAPTITGEAKFGSTLTAIPQIWLSARTYVDYTWYADGHETGNGDPTLELDDGYIGSVITVTMRYYAATKVTSPVSAPTAPVAGLGTLELLTEFTIEGTPAVGSELRTTATWSYEPDTLRYQWSRGIARIPGADGPTYVPTAADIGKKLWVDVFAHTPGYGQVISKAGPTDPIAAPAADE